MRSIIIILIFCMLSCNQQAQNQTITGNKKMEKTTDMPDVVRIDTVAEIKKGTDEKSAAFIKKRLEALVGNFLKTKCLESKVSYPPKFVLFRFFKQEKEFEVWAGNSRSDSLKRILLLPVCAVDDEPGTKLQQGDGKTPEGFYNAAIAYGSTAAFMWIKLNNKDIDTYGTVGEGSSFKMCLDYPNSLDQLQTKTIMKHNNPGSAICIHGNCVSIGCISFENKNYLPVFLSALCHSSQNYGQVKIHIFPFRFNNVTEEQRKKLASKVPNMTEKQALEKWENLEKAYDKSNQKCRVFNIGISRDKYTYSSY